MYVYKSKKYSDETFKFPYRLHVVKRCTGGEPVSNPVELTDVVVLIKIPPFLYKDVLLVSRERR